MSCSRPVSQRNKLDSFILCLPSTSAFCFLMASPNVINNRQVLFESESQVSTCNLVNMTTGKMYTYKLFFQWFQVKTFNEACVMVRQPALEVISYMKKADYSQPALRYLFCILQLTDRKENTLLPFLEKGTYSPYRNV